MCHFSLELYKQICCSYRILLVISCWCGRDGHSMTKIRLVLGSIVRPSSPFFLSAERRSLLPFPPWRPEFANSLAWWRPVVLLLLLLFLLLFFAPQRGEEEGLDGKGGRGGGHGRREKLWGNFIQMHPSKQRLFCGWNMKRDEEGRAGGPRWNSEGSLSSPFRSRFLNEIREGTWKTCSSRAKDATCFAL